MSLQGKEFETRLKEKKPGDLSDELRIALGMPVGPVRSTYIIILCQFTEQKNNKPQRRQENKLIWQISEMKCTCLE